ncbi:hypothetical protein [Streptomyces xylophagus]|uniref:hypothetical protein n=1 Tax=Streptomyces xylophagus TaxID=285514 RepID=UPI0005BAE627|nr:hypothetical protein [Streptomyces xylophagus]
MKKYVKHCLWAFVAVTVVAVAVLVALTVHGLRNLGAESGSGSGSDSVAGARPKSDTGSVRKCVGTRPLGSLPAGEDGSPMERVVARMDKLAEAKRYSAVYTGLSVDEDTQSVDVWRVPSAAFDAEVCGSAVKGATVRLHDADVGRKTLDALSDRIGDDMKRWDGTFEMREVGVDERGFVQVGVDDPDQAEPIIKKAYGAKNARYIKVEHVDQASALLG